MGEIFFISSIWLFLAIISTIVANRLKISIALIEIIIGSLFGFIAIEFNFVEDIHANSEWLRYVASSGAILLTFLAGAELEPEALKKRFNEVSIVGVIGFLAPFIGSALIS